MPSACQRLVYAFQSISPPRHQLFRDFQANQNEILVIPQQSDTRWVYKYAGVHYFHSRLHCILAALTTAAESRNGREKADARGLLLQLKSFDFITFLCLLHDLLPTTQTLSLQLQSPSPDLSSCQLLVAGCTARLQEKRCDANFGHKWFEAGTKSAEVRINVPHTKDQSREGETTAGRRVSRPSQIVSDSNYTSTWQLATALLWLAPVTFRHCIVAKCTQSSTQWLVSYKAFLKKWRPVERSDCMWSS